MEIHIRKWSSMSSDERQKWLSRSEMDIDNVSSDVDSILMDVKTRGDQALLDYTLKFDNVRLESKDLLVKKEEFTQAKNSLSKAIKDSLDYCIENVKKFHRSQMPKPMEWISIRPGVWAGERATPIDSVGLYVPRGRGSFPSMLYMAAVPASLAGVDRIVVITPPGPTGEVDPACLYAAECCGVHEVYKVGGPQAVAALAYGTQTIAPVLKVVGPGSMYVAASKRLLNGIIDVGLPAGPSESMILADATANPKNVSLDLMVEAEHGSDSAAVLVTPSETLAITVAREIAERIALVPEPRKTFLENVFSGYGGIILVDDLAQGVDLVNLWAPEHLSIQTEEPWDILEMIKNAGEILLGHNLPFSGANYATGPNAILPTGGKAKTFSPVSVRDFMKYSSIISTTNQGYSDILTPTVTLADYEGFPSHSAAFTQRKPHGKP